MDEIKNPKHAEFVRRVREIVAKHKEYIMYKKYNDVGDDYIFVTNFRQAQNGWQEFFGISVPVNRDSFDKFTSPYCEYVTFTPAEWIHVRRELSHTNCVLDHKTIGGCACLRFCKKRKTAVVVGIYPKY